MRALWVVLFTLFGLVPVIAQTIEQPSTPDPKSFMQFEWVREGPAEKCGGKCREWISATGRIVDRTPQDFEEFAKTREVRNAPIVLDSNGGLVTAGLALGRTFRRLGVTTTIGRTLRAPDGAVSISTRASCNSMCVFLLIGGARRHVPDDSRVLVHQIWPSSKRDDAAGTTYTAAQMLATQRLLGQVARYTSDMGIETELFEIATRIPPWENLRPLSRDELVRMRVHNADSPFGEFSAIAQPPNAPQGNPLPRSAAASGNMSLGWIYADRAGKQVLTRRHPITIEGQEIGAFELYFGCAEKPGQYRVEYLEKRIGKPAADDVDRVSGVGLMVKNQRAILKVESSLPGNTAGELISVARGAVSTAMLEALTAPGEQTLAVATVTAKKTQTTTRVGRTGLPENLAKLTASCPR